MCSYVVHARTGTAEVQATPRDNTLARMTPLIRPASGSAAQNAREPQDVGYTPHGVAEGDGADWSQLSAR
jgi:hypothetical protein